MASSTKGRGPTSWILSRFTDQDHALICETFQQRRCGFRRFQTLKGFLTAIAVHPDPPPPGRWLRRIWNHRSAPSPRDQAQIEVLRYPILRLHETIRASLEPTHSWYPQLVNWDDGLEKPELHAQAWCQGFYYGMELDPVPWHLLGTEAIGLLRPIALFGTPQGLDAWHRMSASSPKLADQWLGRVAPSVVAIRDYWIRKAAGESFH